MSTQKERNSTVDVVRGFAMLLVVLGHTLSGCTTNFEKSLLLNIIWSLQMPLFMVVSGYVTKYSKSLSNSKALVSYVGKRTLTYLLPWGSFTFVVRGLILGQSSYLNIPYLVYHMDAGYWFLFSIWTITILYGTANYLAGKLHRGNTFADCVWTILFCLLGAGILAGIGIVFGFSFLCIRLTLYYLPFYMIGWLFGKYQSWFLCEKRTKLLEFAVATVILAYIALVYNVDLYNSQDTLLDTALRIIVSLLGIATVCAVAMRMISGGKVSKWFAYVGAHSLEIYLSHYLFLSLLQLTVRPEFLSVSGLALVGANYVITIVLTLLFSQTINTNTYLRLLLFGKR